MNTFITLAARAPWLSGAAVWAVTAASATLNAWGWMTSTAGLGLVTLVLVVLAISSEVLGVRFALRIEAALASGALSKVGVAGVLMCGAVAFNCYSGHRALEMVEQARSAPYRAYEAARADAQARLDEIKAELAAIPSLPDNVPASRLREYRATRDAELARLQPQRAEAEAALDAIAIVEAPPPSIPSGAKWAILILVEALKALALWAVSDAKPKRARPAEVISNPAAELARRRWAAKAS